MKIRNEACSANEISLEDYILLFKRYGRNILFITFFSLAAGMCLYFVRPAYYEVSVKLFPPRANRGKNIAMLQNMSDLIKSENFVYDFAVRSGEKKAPQFIVDALSLARENCLIVSLYVKKNEIGRARASLTKVIQLLVEEYEPQLRALREEIAYRRSIYDKEILSKSVQREQNEKRIKEIEQSLNAIQEEMPAEKMRGSEADEKRAEKELPEKEVAAKATEGALYSVQYSSKEEISRIYLISQLKETFHRLQSENRELDLTLSGLKHKKVSAVSIDYVNPKGEVEKIYTQETEVTNVVPRLSASGETIDIREREKGLKNYLIFSFFCGLCISAVFVLYTENKSISKKG